MTLKIDYDNDRIWLNNKDELHRVDGPAIEYADGSKAWYKNGELHRVNGPAVEYTNGHKAWWVNGKRHRVDGPAVEYADGDKEWWINGVQMTEEEFYAKTQSLKH